MTVTYFLEVNGSHGDGFNVKLENQGIPFIPTEGTMLKVLPDDDYREVDKVYFDAPLNALKIHFKFEEERVFKRLLKQGWEEEK